MPQVPLEGLIKLMSSVPGPDIDKSELPPLRLLLKIPQIRFGL